MIKGPIGSGEIDRPGVLEARGLEALLKKGTLPSLGYAKARSTQKPLTRQLK